MIIKITYIKLVLTLFRS